MQGTVEALQRQQYPCNVYFKPCEGEYQKEKQEIRSRVARRRHKKMQQDFRRQFNDRALGQYNLWNAGESEAASSRFANTHSLNDYVSNPLKNMKMRKSTMSMTIQEIMDDDDDNNDKVGQNTTYRRARPLANGEYDGDYDSDSYYDVFETNDDAELTEDKPEVNGVTPNPTDNQVQTNDQKDTPTIDPKGHHLLAEDNKDNETEPSQDSDLASGVIDELEDNHNPSNSNSNSDNSIDNGNEWWCSKNPLIPEDNLQWILCSSCEYIGAKARVAPFSKLGDGVLHLTYANQMSRAELVECLQNLHNGISFLYVCVFL
ncbi:DBL containing protein [Reticulomyxa filosa]|uniref:DBL containing protein n=1 Tax=Reticulomyxa filosa TaxID=46433 RepID=X6NHC7_RETFI|nr:DBL containing protein [Reticulomyxa filosa]|eukprot:ETO25361.1 DBL containing protein [Reticulomyxa filosa]